MGCDDDLRWIAVGLIVWVVVGLIEWVAVGFAVDCGGFD